MLQYDFIYKNRQLARVGPQAMVCQSPIYLAIFMELAHIYVENPIWVPLEFQILFLKTSVCKISKRHETKRIVNPHVLVIQFQQLSVQSKSYLEDSPHVFFLMFRKDYVSKCKPISKIS